MNKKQLILHAKKIDEMLTNLNRDKSSVADMLKKMDFVDDNDELFFVNMELNTVPSSKSAVPRKRPGKFKAKMPTAILDVLGQSHEPLGLADIVDKLDLKDYPNVANKKVLKTYVSTFITGLYRARKIDRIPRSPDSHIYFYKLKND